MFPTSSQRRYWTFENEEEIAKLRIKHNQEFVERHRYQLGLDNEECSQYFLTPDEERMLLKNYELHLKDFCRRFEPPMPKCIVGTAFHYFKRFYLHNSPMDYHPKEILATCAYLSCKTEEFNVSIDQFVSNIKGDRIKAMDIILSNELLLMQQLNYYLTVHNPFRPIEGFLIDIKARCSMVNPDRLRAGIDEFIDKAFLTDACLLFSPSQLALAAVLNSASKEQENLDSYVTGSLFHDAKDQLKDLVDAVKKIRIMVKTLELPPRDRVKQIEKKLEKCRNQENNPDSSIYKTRMKKMMGEDDEIDLDGSAYQILDSSAADVSMLSTLSSS